MSGAVGTEPSPSGNLKFAGHTSDAKLIGLFEVSVLHNLVHLAFGVAGLVASRRALTSAYYLLDGGLIHAVVWIYGLVMGEESTANFLPLNTADNWLHVVLAVSTIAPGLSGLSDRRRCRSGPAHRARRHGSRSAPGRRTSSPT